MPTSTGSRFWRRLLVWSAALAIATLFVATLVVYNLVALTREAAALRTALVSDSGLHTSLRAQGSAGPVVLEMVRFGTRWISDLPAEGRQALRAVQQLSGAVYELQSTAATGRAQALRHAQAVMEGRGWQPSVQVETASERILIMTRPDEAHRSRIRVCVAVCAEQHLVLGEVSLRRGEVAAFLANLGAQHKII